MNESGVSGGTSRAEALGVVAARWPIEPLKYSLEYLEGPGIMAADFATEGVPLLRISCIAGRYVTLDDCDYLNPSLVDSKWSHFRVRPHDLLISGSASTGVCAEVTEDTVGAVPYTGLIIIRPRSGFDRDFTRWFLLSDVFAKQVALLQAGSAIQHFGPSHLGLMFCPVPPETHQRAISRFLDREVGGLDALVAAKERLLDLLAEKRKAIIATAVTRGLNPKAKLRNSGVTWLGEIPTHWNLRRAKYLFRQSSLPVVAGDEIVTCFRDGQVTLRRNRREEGFTNADLEIGYQSIRQGQLVLHSMDAFAGAIGVSDSNGRCSPEYIICDPLDDGIVVSDYFGPLLRTMALAGFIQASCPAVRERAPRIRFNNFGEMYLPVLPVAEQHGIVEHLARETAKLDARQAATERTIALLKERRAALIAAAVTGQLGIRETASGELLAATNDDTLWQTTQ